MKSKVRVVGYARVSTKEQANSGISIDAQIEKQRQYCSLFELELVDIKIDRGRSAKTLDREGLQEALAMLKSDQADALLVVKLDRLVRSTVGLGHLVADYFSDGHKYSLLSVAENIDTRTAAGRLVANVLASVGQWEREAIVERTKEALAHLRALGVLLGGESEAYGLKRGPRQMNDAGAEGRRLIEEITQEVENILLIRTWWTEGLSLRKICKRLHENGVPTKRREYKIPTKGIWHPKVVRSILLRDGVPGDDLAARRQQQLEAMMALSKKRRLVEVPIARVA